MPREPRPDRFLAAHPAESPFAVAEQFEFVGVVLLDGFAVADTDQDGVGQLGPNQVVHQVFQTLVERRRGLVEEHRLGGGQQYARERDSLLLAGERIFAQSSTSSSRPVRCGSATFSSVRFSVASSISPSSLG